jgi:hypothetical protein
LKEGILNSEEEAINELKEIKSYKEKCKDLQGLCCGFALKIILCEIWSPKIKYAKYNDTSDALDIKSKQK